MLKSIGIAALLLAAANAVVAVPPLAGEGDKFKERHRLYTPPDPASTGGIKGVVALPGEPLETVLAIPADNPDLVYEGRLMEPDKRGFLFENLPMAKYDLVMVYPDAFYEGLQLTREEDTLTAADREKIKAIVDASDVFFTKKVFHRIEGTTGRGNTARCLVTMCRDKAAFDQFYAQLKGFRRTFKLIWLKDVGVGWQVVQKRDLYPVTVDAAHMNPGHSFSSALARIRVTDKVKDLGTINVSNVSK